MEALNTSIRDLSARRNRQTPGLARWANACGIDPRAAHPASRKPQYRFPCDFSDRRANATVL